MKPKKASTVSLQQGFQTIWFKGSPKPTKPMFYLPLAPLVSICCSTLVLGTYRLVKVGFILASGGSISWPASKALISKSFLLKASNSLPPRQRFFNSFTEVITEIQNTAYQLFKVYHTMSFDICVHTWLGNKHTHHLQSLLLSLWFFSGCFLFVFIVIRHLIWDLLPYHIFKCTRQYC